MKQFVEFVNVTQKIEDKISQMEIKRHRKFSDAEKQIAQEIFLSGFLFGLQWEP